MFRNIGGKLKGFAVFIFVLQTLGYIIGGGILISGRLQAIGIIIMIAGPLLAWVSSWLLYGFGELIHKVSSIEELLYSGGRVYTSQKKTKDERIENINNMYSEGLITKEEYIQALRKIQEDILC